MCVSINFTSLFLSLLNACHPPSPLLFSVPLVSIRLTRLWTILCPVSVVLGQPALRAARKVMFTPRTQLCCLRCLSCCFNLYNSQLHLSVSLSAPRAARACASCCGCLGRRTSRGRGEFQCIQLGHWVDVCLAVPASPYFHVGNTNILWVIRLWWCRHIQIDFHTFHFSFLLTFYTCFFFLPANFLHLLFFFLPATSLSQPSTSFSQQSTVCSHFLTYMFNTFATTTWLLKPLSVL